MYLIFHKTIFCIIVLVTFIAPRNTTKAQTVQLSLDETIALAQEKSLDAFRAKNMYQIKELYFQDFLNGQKPHLNLRLTPVDYNRSINEVYNSVLKKYEPVEIQRLVSSYNLGVNQNVGFTGGDISIYSSLMRSQRFGGITNNNVDYISTPLSIGYRHNFAQINNYKWKSKIEPLKFEQAKLEFIEQQEAIAIRTVSLFFSLLSDQMNYDIAVLNYSNAKALYKNGIKRGKIGSISRDELLNLKLKRINASITVEQTQNRLENSRLDICEFLELPQETDVVCLIPEQNKLKFIDPKRAQDLAITNNPDSKDLARKLLEARKQVAQAKQSRYGINLSAGIGFNQQKNDFNDAFKDLLDRQNFKVSIDIPILDWGETKRRIQKSELNEEMVKKENEKTRELLLLEIAKNTSQFNMKTSELESAAMADTVSQYAYDATQQRFAIGKVNVIAINESYKSLYSAKNRYMGALWKYWQYYFTMRKLCLFDFENEQDLEAIYPLN